MGARPTTNCEKMSNQCKECLVSSGEFCCRACMCLFVCCLRDRYVSSTQHKREHCLKQSPTRFGDMYTSTGSSWVCLTKRYMFEPTEDGTINCQVRVWWRYRTSVESLNISCRYSCIPTDWRRALCIMWPLVSLSAPGVLRADNADW